MQVERIEAISIDKNTALNYAKHIIKEQIGQAVKNIKYLGGGSFGIAYGVEFFDGKKIVVKFLRAADMLDKEVYDLRLLASNCPKNIPEVLFVRKADESIPVDCYGMDMIDGKSALMSFGMMRWTKRKKKDFADMVTTALHEIHCCKNEKFGDTLCTDCESWLDYNKTFGKAVLDIA